MKWESIFHMFLHLKDEFCILKTWAFPTDLLCAFSIATCAQDTRALTCSLLCSVGVFACPCTRTTFFISSCRCFMLLSDQSHTSHTLTHMFQECIDFSWPFYYPYKFYDQLFKFHEEPLRIWFGTGCDNLGRTGIFMVLNPIHKCSLALWFSRSIFVCQ